MIKKLIKLFKKTKTKKRVVVNKKDKAEIINFVNKAKKTNKIQTEKEGYLSNMITSILSSANLPDDFLKDKNIELIK